MRRIFPNLGHCFCSSNALTQLISYKTALFRVWHRFFYIVSNGLLLRSTRKRYGKSSVYHRRYPHYPVARGLPWIWWIWFRQSYPCITGNCHHYDFATCYPRKFSCIAQRISTHTNSQKETDCLAKQSVSFWLFIRQLCCWYRSL